MAKIFNAIIILEALLILLAFAGMPTITNSLLGLFGFTVQSSDLVNPVSFNDNYIYALAVALFGLGAIGGIIAGGSLFGYSDSRMIGMALGTGFMTLMVGDLVSILTWASSTGYTWIIAPVYIFIVPLTLGIVIATVQWWRGADI